MKTLKTKSKVRECVNYPHLASEDTTAVSQVRVWDLQQMWTLDRPLCLTCTEIAIETAIADGNPYAVGRIETETSENLK